VRIDESHGTLELRQATPEELRFIESALEEARCELHIPESTAGDLSALGLWLGEHRQVLALLQAARAIR
jgi:hypothetical protein